MNGISLNEGRIHLHVENSPDVNEVFDISASRVRDALARHPAIAARVRVSIGYGGDILDRELASADAVFCWDFDRRDLGRRAPRLRWVHTRGGVVSVKHRVKCQRCRANEARYRVYTDEMSLKVCTSCAMIARRRGIAVEVLPRLRTFKKAS